MLLRWPWRASSDGGAWVGPSHRVIWWDSPMWHGAKCDRALCLWFVSRGSTFAMSRMWSSPHHWVTPRRMRSIFEDWTHISVNKIVCLSTLLRSRGRIVIPQVFVTHLWKPLVQWCIFGRWMDWSCNFIYTWSIRILWINIDQRF